MDKFDVIIVGCGPAGSTAGYMLGRSGIPTLLLDRSEFPRRKLCGGGLTNKTMGLLGRVFHETADSLQQSGIINASSEEYDIYFRDRLITHGLSRFPFMFTDRYVYDDFLLQKARNTGCTTIKYDKVVGFDPEDNIIKTASGRTYQSRFIIGADSANSVIRKHMPPRIYSAKKWEHNLAIALETYIPRLDFAMDIFHPIIYFGYVDWGYSWIFPNDNAMLVGMGSLCRKTGKDLKQKFRDFISAITPVYSIDITKDLKVLGYPVPSGNYLKRPAYKNTLLVGDAAGFADPISGEGIYQAQRSAEIASLSIIRAMSQNLAADQLYIDLLKRYVFQDLLYARILRWLVFTAMNCLNFNQICLLTKRGEKRALDIVHGLRTYRFLKLTSAAHEDIL